MRLSMNTRYAVIHASFWGAYGSLWVLEFRNGRTRIAFYPLTGRTHQLRVHAAHPSGLNAPIAGDRLYGTAGRRLLLHAERIEFRHPATGDRIAIEKPADF